MPEVAAIVPPGVPPISMALLSVPDTALVAGVLALGYPVHQPTRLRRAPVEDFATIDRFDGPPLVGP